MTTTTKQVPANACRLSLPCQFAEDDERSTPKIARIKGLARSAEPVNHYYWGRVVHDFAGMKPRGDKLHLDYQHRELIGVVNEFSVTDAGLEIVAEVQSIRESDLAWEVITRGKLGTPYELSIDFWDPVMRVEEFGDGIPVVVNGQQFTGPLTVIREWRLNSVAVCPYGYDANSEAQFGRPPQPTCNVTIFTQEPSMSVTAPAPAAPAADPTKLAQPSAASPTPATPTTPAVDETLAKLSRFTDAFGAEKGLAHFKAGKTFEAALIEEHAALTTQFAAQSDEIASLKQVIAATKLGVDKPAGMSVADGSGSGGTGGGGVAATQFAHLGAAGGFAAFVEQQMAKK